MGAMLVCGVLPIVDSITLPAVDSGAPSLRNAAVPAHPRLIADAHRVLDDWIDAYLDRVEGSEATTAVSTPIHPDEFLIWCDDEYDNVPESRKPSWIEHWESLIGYGRKAGSLRPVPDELVAHAAELANFAAGVQIRLLQPASFPQNVHGDEVGSDFKSYVASISAVINAKSRSPIASLIVKALGASSDPRNPTSVFAELTRMAKSGQYSVLDYKAKTREFEIPRGKANTVPYKQTTLKLFLSRYAKDAGLKN